MLASRRCSVTVFLRTLFCCMLTLTQVGASGSCQSESPASVRHGVVTSARLDRHSHMVGDCKPQRGDSGAGCFLVATGALFAICVGRAGVGGEDAALLPIAIPQSKIRELEAGQSVQP